MKNRISLGAFIFGCAVLITAALYAGRHSFDHCDKCRFYSIKAQKDSQPYILTDLYKCKPAGIKLTVK